MLHTKKVVLFALFVFIVLGTTLGILFYKQKKNNEKWNDPSYVFDIPIPSGFNEDQKQRLAQKVEEAKKLYAEKRDDDWTWTGLGTIYEYVKDYDRAIAAYERALSIYPGNISATLNLATIYERHQVDLEKAEFYYQKAVEIKSDAPEFHEMLGDFYFKTMKDPEKAEEVYLDGLNKSNLHPHLFVVLISFYESTGNTDKRDEYTKIFLEKYPTYTEIQRDFGVRVE